MAEYGVFESTRMASTKYVKPILSGISTSDVENGTFGYLDGLADGETAIYKFVPGTKAGATIVVVDNPAWSEDTNLSSNQRKDKYINKAGTAFRVREIAKGDKFSINSACVTSGTVEKLDEDAFLTIDATTGKLKASATTTASAVMEAVVESKRVQGGMITTVAHNYGYSRTMYKAKVTVLA